MLSGVVSLCSGGKLKHERKVIPTSSGAYKIQAKLAGSQEFSNGSTYSYEYDSLNRLTTVKENGTIKLRYTYDNANWIDQLTKIKGTTITYDGMGNPLKWRNASLLDWDGRKLKSFTKADNTVISYTYDENGLRTSKTVGSDRVDYVYDGSKLIEEKHAGYMLTFLYDDSNTLIGFNYSTSSFSGDFYYGIDNFGNINYIYDSTGDIITTYKYDAWGRLISTTGIHAERIGKRNPFRYKSYYYDAETELYYLQSRYYDASVGLRINLF